MPEVLLVLDRPEWAFDFIARQLIARNDRGLELSPFFLKGREDGFRAAWERADLVFFLHWSLSARLSRP